MRTDRWNKKRELNLYAFYDHTGLERHLEKMAANGWMLESVGTYALRYRRCEPKKLRFAVVYYPKTDSFCPDEPNHENLTFWDYCAGAGWQIVTQRDDTHIFYNEDLDAVQLFKVSAGGCQIVFLAGAVDDQLALGLGGVDQGLLGSSGLRCRSRGIGGRGSRSRLGSRGRCIAAAGCQRSNHQNGHQNCKNLFHRLCFLHLLILLRKYAYLKRTSFRMLTLYTGDFVLSIGVISYFSRLLGASG